MAKIHQGHDILSLFGIVQDNKVLNQNIVASRNLLVSVISAFFIVLAVSLFLRISTGFITGQAVASTPVSPAVEEPAAYLPGQYI